MTLRSNWASKLILSLVCTFILLTGAACTTIQPGHVGIVVNQWGSDKGVQDHPTTVGLTFFNPLSTTVFSYPTNVQTAKWTASLTEGKATDESISFTNKDNMVISADVSLSYTLDAAKVPAFYVKFRNDDIDTFTHGYLRNVARDAFNETGGNYDIDHIMGDNAGFLKAVRDKIQEQTKDIGVTIQQFGIIGAARPPQGVTDSINAKLQATQIAIQKENEVRQAQADAAKAVATAEGAAKAAIAQAEGEAKANSIRNATMTPQMMELRRLEVQEKAIDKWDGAQPSIMSGNGQLLYNIPKP